MSHIMSHNPSHIHLIYEPVNTYVSVPNLLFAYEPIFCPSSLLQYLLGSKSIIVLALSETIQNSYARKSGEMDELVEIIKKVNNENLENKFF